MAIGLVFALGAAASQPHRIVSANLCADQLLLALGDRDQIASLSPYARDPELSYLAESAQGIEQNRGSVEDVLRLDADLVLIGSYDSRYARALLEAKAVPFLVLAPWQGLEDGKAQIRALAERLGHRDRGDRLIATIELGTCCGIGRRARTTQRPRSRTARVRARSGQPDPGNSRPRRPK